MKKLFIIPIFFAFAFSQISSYKVSYTIYTTTKSYPNVISLHSVEGEDLVVKYKNIIKKNIIPIVSINRIKIKEKKPNPIGKPLGCVYGLGLGALGGGLIGLVLDSGGGGGGYGSYFAVTELTILGGMAIGALRGIKMGNNLYGSQTQLVNLKDKPLDEKIDYLKSIAKQ